MSEKDKRPGHGGVFTGYTEMVLSEMPESIAARRLRTVIDAGIKASGVAQNLLAFSRQSPLQPIDCDLNETILGMDRVLDAVAQGRVTIHYELSQTDIPVRVDKTKLFQVMLNLAVNACDAMSGGGQLTISTEQITIIAGVPGHGLMGPGPAGTMKFTDTGSGIDDDTKKHLFEPFFTRKAPGKGTGLGLATVAGIIGQSGGHVSVISEVGKGSTFTVFLPLRTAITPSEVSE